MSDETPSHETVGRMGATTVNTEAAPGQSRYCVDPWTQPFILENGNVWPCCWFYESLGNINTQSFAEIWDGPEARRLRQELLTGHLRKQCQTCPSRALTTKEALLTRVRALPNLPQR
jgi:radical SAM protein with 4Fe4S-binding SPASM domain